MLSILIPIYNINCVKLVVDLQKQCHKAKIKFEILCYDDDSKTAIKDQNKRLAHLFGVSYVEMKENYGRAKLRNKLARSSNGLQLVFIDADSKTLNRSFIKNYLPYLQSNTVVYGGRAYTSRKPAARKKVFHWTYGTQREAIGASKRNKSMYLNFMSNNFMVPRSIFEKVNFDPAHTGYGYEDTVYATRLKKAGYKILHIDNPLLHTGLENTDTFLVKTREALDNLVEMYVQNEIIDTRLIRFYKLLKRYKLEKITHRYLAKRLDRIEENLRSEFPRMRNFDAWKLHYFLGKMEQNNR